MLRKSSLSNAFDTKYVQNHYFEGKCSENHHLKMHLTPHMCKTIILNANAKKITLKANAQEIITLKCI